MPRIVLHIGPHKTGTTYLHLVFQALRPVLRAAGIVFPEQWRDSREQPGHHRLASALAAGDVESPRREFTALAEIGGETWLLSSENLVTLQAPGLRDLRRLLGDAPVEVVFYIRRWSDLLPSVWQERIKHGFCETFPRFLANATANPGAIPFVDPGPVLDRFANIFGRTSIRIVSYDSVGEAGFDLAAHFLATFFPDRPDLPAARHDLSGTRPNSAYAHTDIEIVRVLNLIHEQRGGQRGPGAREWLMTDGRRHDLSVLTGVIAASADDEPVSDSDGLFSRLHDRLWNDYGDRLVAPMSAWGFFQPKTRRVPHAGSEYLADATVRAAYESLYRAFIRSATGSTGDR